MRLVLLGLPGAGKEKDTFGLRVQEYMNKGELVPDEWIISLVKSRLQAKDVENGFVLDGYPRTLQQ